MYSLRERALTIFLLFFFSSEFPVTKFNTYLLWSVNFDYHRHILTLFQLKIIFHSGSADESCHQFFEITRAPQIIFIILHNK